MNAVSNVNPSEKLELSSSLLWVRGRVENQFLDMLLDSGASTSCIAKRCVNASPYLKNLPRSPYNGTGLFDVNPFTRAFGNISEKNI